LADKQNKLKEPYINEQKNKETEIKGLTVSLDNKEDQIKEVQQNIETVQNKIETLKFEINDIPEIRNLSHQSQQRCFYKVLDWTVTFDSNQFVSVHILYFDFLFGIF
jgi:chromosome segregation ATPase